MGSVESKERAQHGVRVKAKSPYQPHAKDSVAEQKKRSSLFASMLLRIVDAPSLQLPFPRRVALLESIRKISRQHASESSPQETHHYLIEVVMEGLLTCESLSPEDKNVIVLDGLLEQRWDLVIARHTIKQIDPMLHSDREDPNVTQDAFVAYRRMFLVLFKDSRKLQQCLPETSRQRIKKMMLETKNKNELEDLLSRILERLCGIDVQKRIMQDVSDGRYYRLVWPDRMECEDSIAATKSPGVTTNQAVQGEEEEDRKLPAVETAVPPPMVFGSILLPDDLSHRQDCCPICLDPIQAPALQLSCQHSFCSRCITNWIRQNNRNMAVDTDKSLSSWHCPVCRQAYNAK